MLDSMFYEKPFDFEKKCKHRIIYSLLLAVLGGVAVMMVFVFQKMPVFILEPGHRDFIPGFYVGAGGGLIGASIATIIKNVRYLKNPQIRKKQEIIEKDERNRLLGLRSWAYTGYFMFLFLYIGMLISGFISLTVLKVLLVVAGVYGVSLLICRRVIQKYM